MQQECQLNIWMLAYMDSMVNDLTDEQIYTAFAPTNPPSWLLGHLAAEGDKALQTLGESERLLPEEWHRSYLQGYSPQDVQVRHSKEELLAANHRVYARLREVVSALPTERLQEPSHSEFLRAHLPTRGAWLAHILTTHIAMHAGQIQMWRRLQGLPRAFEA
jgi:DinB superfamily